MKDTLKALALLSFVWVWWRAYVVGFKNGYRAAIGRVAGVSVGVLGETADAYRSVKGDRQ